MYCNAFVATELGPNSNPPIWNVCRSLPWFLFCCTNWGGPQIPASLRLCCTACLALGPTRWWTVPLTLCIACRATEHALQMRLIIINKLLVFNIPALHLHGATDSLHAGQCTQDVGGCDAPADCSLEDTGVSWETDCLYLYLALRIVFL